TSIDLCRGQGWTYGPSYGYTGEHWATKRMLDVTIIAAGATIKLLRQNASNINTCRRKTKKILQVSKDMKAVQSLEDEIPRSFKKNNENYNNNYKNYDPPNNIV
ncbi:25410_t:CDS:2, partial [Gigaspora margarita]